MRQAAFHFDDMEQRARTYLDQVKGQAADIVAAAARVHIAEKGLDPRSFAMVATGGAGPVHVVEVAHKLGIRRVLCPVAAGNGSCLGLLIAPPRVDRSWSKPELLEFADWIDAAQRLDLAYADCMAELDQTGVSPLAVEWSIHLEMRYEGQGDTITVTFPYGNVDDAVRPGAAAKFTESLTLPVLKQPNNLCNTGDRFHNGACQRDKRSCRTFFSGHLLAGAT